MTLSTNISKQKLETVMRDSCRALMTTALGSKGMVRVMYNTRTNTWQNRYKVDDFGDYAPFILATGILLDDKNLQQFPEKQLELLKSTKRQGLYHTLDPKFPLGKYTNKIRDNDDLLEGLLQCYRLTKNRTYLLEAQRVADAVTSHLMFGNQFVERTFLNIPLPRRVYSIVRSPKNFMSDLTSVSSADCSGFMMDCFVAISELSGIKEYLTIAERVMARWLATKTFQTLGLFPDRVIPYVGYEAPVSTIMKPNSHIAFALLGLIRATGKKVYHDAFKQWLNALDTHLKTPGGYFSRYIHKRHSPDYNIRLTQNHALFELRLQWYAITKDPALLSTIEEDIQHWLVRQAPNGLFPEQLWKKNTANDTSSSDTQGDFLNILMKLDMITKKATYRNAIDAGINGLIQNFLRSDGLWLEEVWTHTGIQAKDTLLTKFCGGSLKSIIAYYCMQYPTTKIPANILTTLIDDR